MAIAFDTASSIYQGSTVTSQNLSHTCSGSNRILTVSTRTYDGDGVTGVTYNGVAMSAVSSVTTGVDVLKTWMLVNPTSGTNTITATLSIARRIEIFAASFTGALQTGQPDASQTATGTSASATASVTTVTDNAWSVAFVALNGASGTITNGTNCTVANSINDRGAVGYGGPNTPAGSFTQAMTLGASGAWAFAQVAIAPTPNLENVKTFNGLAKASIKTINGTNIGDIKSINGLE